MIVILDQATSAMIATVAGGASVRAILAVDVRDDPMPAIVAAGLIEDHVRLVWCERSHRRLEPEYGVGPEVAIERLMAEPERMVRMEVY